MDLVQQPESSREVLVRAVVGSAASTAEVVSADEAKREALYDALTAVSPRGDRSALPASTQTETNLDVRQAVCTER